MTKEEVYEKQCVPLIKQLFAICETNGLALLVSCQAEETEVSITLSNSLMSPPGGIPAEMGAAWFVLETGKSVRTK